MWSIHALITHKNHVSKSYRLFAAKVQHCSKVVPSIYYSHVNSVTVYAADLIALIQRHGFCPHLYADDTQI